MSGKSTRVGSATLFAAVIASALLLAGSAGAQTYGGVTLYPGFPGQTLSGMSGGQPGVPGGEMDSSAWGTTPTGACRGYVAPTPNHTMTLSGAMGNITISVNATDSGDTALVVSGPGGTFCNDDSIGLNPSITASLAPGTYNIWVASYGMGTTHPYTISWMPTGMAVTPTAPPIPPQPPMPVGGLQTTAMAPTDMMGAINLATGFVPDPQTRSGNVTGAVDANTTPNLYGGTCRGYTQSIPNHMMNLTTPFSYLRVHIHSTSDTTLIVQDPGGGFWCNDDTDGLNPVIEGPWQPGTWRIWIGTYSPGTTATYTVDFTEFQR